MKRGALALAALMAVACGDGEPAAEGGARKSLAAGTSQEATGANRAPDLSGVALSTRSPVPGVPIEARFEASDPDGSPLTFELTWLLNGSVVQAGEQRTWTPSDLSKGDRIELRVSVSDGELTTGPVSASARVGNRPPEVARVVLQPREAPARGETLTATPVASDADGDEVEFAYEWIVNGEVVRGERAERFELDEVQRGDRVQARVRASDGESEDVIAQSEEVTVANAAPKLEKFSGFEASDGGFRHQLQATDPDGDKGLRFVLAEGPRGMEVDPTLGIITWRPEDGVSGKIPVQVEVTDPLGASSALRFELTVGGAEPASAAQPTAPASPAESE